MVVFTKFLDPQIDFQERTDLQSLVKRRDHRDLKPDTVAYRMHLDTAVLG